MNQPLHPPSLPGAHLALFYVGFQDTGVLGRAAHLGGPKIVQRHQVMDMLPRLFLPSCSTLHTRLVADMSSMCSTVTARVHGGPTTDLGCATSHLMRNIYPLCTTSAHWVCFITPCWSVRPPLVRLGACISAIAISLLYCHTRPDWREAGPLPRLRFALNEKLLDNRADLRIAI